MEAAMAPPPDREYDRYMQEMNIQTDLHAMQKKGQQDHTGDSKVPGTPLKLENKLARTPMHNGDF